MASLWTPDGERRIEPEPSAPSGPPDTAPGAAPGAEERPRRAPGGPAEPGPGPEVAAAAEAEMAALERDLVEAPAEDVVANHCYGLFQLAALHLSQQPPNFDKARLAIDALGAVVEALGERLGEPGRPLTEGLAQIRLAFVQLAGSGPGAAPGGSA